MAGMLWRPWSCSTSRGGGEQRGNAQDGSVTLRQLWNGVPVLPCRATLVYEGGELKRIEEGRRLTGTPQTTAGTPITATTALMRFYAGLSERMDICSEVREIEVPHHHRHRDMS